jgi:hypothetical protein
MLIDWFLKDNMLIRLDPRARKTLFVSSGTQDREDQRVPVEDLLKAWRQVESRKWNLRMEPSGLPPTIGQGLMIHAKGRCL